MNKDLEKLTHLGLISKICSELENHLGFSEKTLAEFIIHLANESIKELHDTTGISNTNKQLQQDDKTITMNKYFKRFYNELCQNDAEFPEIFALRLFTIIQSTYTGTSNKSNNSNNSYHRNEKDKQFPSLAKPNTAPIPLDITMISSTDNVNTKKSNEEDYGIVQIQRNTRTSDRDESRQIREESRYTRDESRHARDSRRDRDNSRERNDSRERDRKRGRSRSSSPSRIHRNKVSQNQINSEPELYGIYSGKVTNILDFGCFVELDGFKRKEGLVHVSHIQNGLLRDPKQVVKRNDIVKVKVISIVGNKLSLSMKEVDQLNGMDLFPERSKESIMKISNEMNNPSRPSHVIGKNQFHNNHQDDDHIPRKKKLSSPEMWEIKQLINSGVLKASDYPMFSNEIESTNTKSMMRQVLAPSMEVEEDIDIELNDLEPAFLQGQTKVSKELSPLRIVKNPDGSMQRAALHQSQLSKERKELKSTQSNNLIDAQPKDLSKPWEDPMAASDDKKFALERRHNISTSFELPEWKQKTQIKGLSYGQISNKSMKDQRENLPIYKLKSELCQAIAQNQVLIVIGETGSGNVNSSYLF